MALILPALRVHILPVVEETYAFSGCSSLTSIEIPNSVTSIEEQAFSGCSSLISIEIPNSVTSIGGYAFRGCSSLTSVSIGSGVTSIGYNAFSECLNSKIIFKSTTVPTIGSGAFGSGATNMVSHIFVPNEALEDYKTALPDYVSIIEGYDFEDVVTITWQNWDGTTLDEEQVAFANLPVYNSAPPTRTATAKYTYEWDGWTLPVELATEDATYTASFTRNGQAYTITYNSNDGTDRTLTQNVIYTGSFTTYNYDAFERNGYKIVGWSKDPNTQTGIYCDVNTYYGFEDTENITLYAMWSLEYSITYDLDGGTLTTENRDWYTEVTPTFTLNNPRKDYYNFTGWTGSNGSTPETTVQVEKGTTGNLTYTANWAPIEYTIDYILNDGTVTNPGTYTVESESFTLSNPTKEGYDFAGWTGTGLTDPELVVTILTGSYGNREYTATWAEVYSITYNLNGGSVSNREEYSAITETFTLNNPTKKGYTFLGWTGSNGENPQTTVTIPAGSTGNREYVANWEIITYTITTIVQGVETEQNYTVESASITLVQPTRAGATFKGWTGTNGTTPQKNITIAHGSTGDRTYTANWTLTNYTLKYTLYGGTVSPANPTKFNVETETFTLNNPTKANYDFLGWTGGGLTEPTLEVTIETGSLNNRTYVANWTPTEYTITYTLNGGTAENVEVYTVESNSITLVNPTKEGYNFVGWTGSNGETPQLSVIIPTGSTGNKEYTANWSEPIVYTITYTLNGGTATNPATYTVESESITLVNPTKAGYTFLGWTGSNGEEPSLEVVIPHGSTENRVYTANWSEAIVYTITYTLNGGNATNPATYTVESNSITLVNPTKAGYNFVGWTGSNGEEPSLEVVIPQGSTGNKVYTANWSEPIVYTITYTLNGGAAINSTSYTVESNSITFVNPTKVGYTFTGWIGSNGDEPELVVVIPQGSTGNKEYVANWSLNQYKIILHIDNEVKVINYNILSKDQVIEKPTKKGFNFLGWTGEDLTEATMDLVVPKGSTGDREYTATWEEAPTNTLAIALGVGIPGGAILIAGVVLIVLAKQKKIKLW